MILGLQRGHGAETGSLYNRLRLCEGSQGLMVLSEAILELASSLSILQNGGKMFWVG
jgi:hypothetical protein